MYRGSSSPRPATVTSPSSSTSSPFEPARIPSLLPLQALERHLPLTSTLAAPEPTLSSALLPSQLGITLHSNKHLETSYPHGAFLIHLTRINTLQDISVTPRSSPGVSLTSSAISKNLSFQATPATSFKRVPVLATTVMDFRYHRTPTRAKASEKLVIRKLCVDFADSARWVDLMHTS
ncbi:hypothetical protein OBBRIDRAFT_350758 [Obba rivulosa]|uniref:Uncharacterized protein n=1 Tax=Obba rivulosa TaxID=1052685 RepID=A0A8E2DP67_9APHY|nr:hypothetical protein OBBRIDRAFT_350758 [Obba rivulosa]